MVKRKITPEMEAKQFRPGQSGNPGGKPKQLLTKDKVKGLVDRFYHMSREDLKKVASNPKSTVIELTIASIMVKCIEAGDFSRFDGLLNRAVGRVVDEIKVSPGDSVASEAIRAIPVTRLGEVIETLKLTNGEDGE